MFHHSSATNLLRIWSAVQVGYLLAGIAKKDILDEPTPIDHWNQSTYHLMLLGPLKEYSTRYIPWVRSARDGYLHRCSPLLPLSHSRRPYLLLSLPNYTVRVVTLGFPCIFTSTVMVQKHVIPGSPRGILESVLILVTTLTNR